MTSCPCEKEERLGPGKGDCGCEVLWFCREILEPAKGWARLPLRSPPMLHFCLRPQQRDYSVPVPDPAALKREQGRDCAHLP